MQLLLFIHLDQLGRSALLIQEASDGCCCCIHKFGTWFSACSADIKLIKRQCLAEEQTNMLISSDQSAWEQFMCINEVKNSVKQSSPAAECRASHM